MKDIYPLTITVDRYGGLYSGGAYLAFNCHPDEVTDRIHESDERCIEFWMEEPDYIIGKGATIDEAITDLASKLKKTINIHDKERFHG